MKSLFFSFFLIFLTSVFSQDYTLKKYKGDPLRTWHYTLNNGLQVFLTENHEKPVFYAEVVIRAGSSSDPAETTGIAHYLEHMLFKGTTRFGTVDFDKEKPHLDKITDLYEQHFKAEGKKARDVLMHKISLASEEAAQYAIPNEFDRMYQRLGGTGVNAHTSNEETVYKVVCPSNSLSKWCLIESERFRQPVFRLFQTEIEAVYEEKNGSLDSKDSALYEAFLAKMFKKHPYGQQTTLGSVEHLKSPSITSMYNFYKKYYVPNNMAIVISGDIDPPQAIKEISRYFSSWKKGNPGELTLPREDPLKGEEVVEVDFPGEEQLMMGFRIPVEGHEDEHALKFVDMILDNSQAGLINVNLNQALKVKRAGSYPMMFNDYACHVFYGLPKKGQPLEQVKNLILEQIKKVQKGKFDEWLLPAILADFKKAEQSSYEKNSSRVSTLRDLFIARQSVEKLTRDMEAFAKVTKEDIVRVANKYYKNNYVIAYRRDKEIEKVKMTKPSFKKVKADASRESLFSKRVGYLPVKPLKPAFVNFKKDFAKKEIAKGLTLYHTENPVNGLFTVSLKIPLGKRHEPLLPLLASLLKEGGWKDKSPEEVSNSFYRKAASFTMAVGSNETVISLFGLDDSFEDTVNLLHELLQKFETDPQRIKTQAGIIIDTGQKQKKEPGYLSYALANYSRYKEESPFLTAAKGSDLLAATPDRLRSVLNRLLNTEMKINYIGRKSVKEAAGVISIFASEGKAAPAKIKLKSLSVEKAQINFLNHNSVQTHIRMEFPGDIYDIKEEAAYMLFNEYFDGSLGSVVFQEIREKRALAYSAWSRYFPRGEKGLRNLMICALSTQADKTIEAMDVFHDIVYKFPFDEKRFKVAKGALLKQLQTKRLNFRSRLDTIQSWEDLDITEDPNRMHLNQIKRLTMDDLRKFVKEKVYGKKFSISIVGDKSRIDLKKLKKFGSVSEVQIDQIFVD